MKVIYIVKSLLHFYPPCVTQIRLLHHLGVDVEVLFGSCSEVVTTIFDREHILYKKLKDERGVYNGILDKINNYYCFRKSLTRELKDRNLKDTLLWFGNAETLLSMKWSPMLSKSEYAITFLELLDDKPFRMKMLKEMARKAKFNLACEETRAYIMKFWWGLDSLPYVIPNKPYEVPNVNSEITDNDVKALLNKLGDKKVILYQGYIKDYNKLKSFAEAISKLSDDFILLLMGPDPLNLFEKLSNISTSVVYSPYITAPNHLQITKHAFAGIVYYDGDSTLNRAFCAPNKIYEYSAFGIPMIANKIPGLTHTVGSCGAAVCCELEPENIIQAIHIIMNNYDKMKEASRKFYEATDIVNIMKEIVNKHIV